MLSCLHFRNSRIFISQSMVLLCLLVSTASGHAGRSSDAQETLSAEMRNQKQGLCQHPPRNGQSQAECARQFLREQLGPVAAGGVFVVSTPGQPHVVDAFGVADAVTGEPMTPSLRLGYGSVTKSFSGALAALLESEGVLDLGAPLAQSFPELRLYADERRVNFEQLLSHSSGLPRHDFSWMFRDLTSAEYFERLRFLPFAAEPGQRFIYSNLGYHIFGEWLTRHSRSGSWAALLRSRILNPLSLTSVAPCDDGAAGKVALPHERDASGAFVPVSRPLSLDVIAPAGALCGTVSDLVRWIQIFDQRDQESLILDQNLDQNLDQLERHREDQPADQARRIYAQVAGRLLAPTTPVGVDGVFRFYSFGLIQGELGGDQVLWHNGGTSGFNAHVSLNRSSGAVVAVVTNSNFDLDSLAFDAHRILAGSSAEPVEPLEPDLKELTEVPLERPDWIQEVLGVYEHPGYGTVRVSPVDGQPAKLQATLNGWLTIGPLVHIGSGVFSMTPVPLATAHILGLQFIKESLHWRLESLVEPIRFERTADL